MVFSLTNEVGCLVKALRLFQVRRRIFAPFRSILVLPSRLRLFLPLLLPFLQEKHVNLRHIESRPSRRVVNEVEIFADCSCSQREFKELLEHLEDHLNIISFNTPAHVWSTEAGRNTWDTVTSSMVTGQP